MSSVKNAVVQRFKEICTERNIKPNELANLSGVTPSTVYSLFSEDRNNVSITTIKILCDGLEITLGQFFSTDIFNDLEQEIKVACEPETLTLFNSESHFMIALKSNLISYCMISNIVCQLERIYHKIVCKSPFGNYTSI